MKPTRRIEIQAYIESAIKNANAVEIEIEEQLLISQTCLRFGCGERIVKEILKHLKNCNIVIAIDDELSMQGYVSQLNKEGDEDGNSTNTTTGN